MRKRSYLSLLVALCLTFGAVAAPSALSAGLTDEGASVVGVPADTTSSERPKGNGFVRAITAPFRALGRLFGGGKKRGETAKKNKETEKKRGDGMGASVGAAVAAETPRRKAAVEERRARPAAAPRASATEPAGGIL